MAMIVLSSPATLIGVQEKKTGPSRFIANFLTELTKLSKFRIYKRACTRFTRSLQQVYTNQTRIAHSVYTQNTPSEQSVYSRFTRSIHSVNRWCAGLSHCPPPLRFLRSRKAGTGGSADHQPAKASTLGRARLNNSRISSTSGTRAQPNAVTNWSWVKVSCRSKN